MISDTFDFPLGTLRPVVNSDVPRLVRACTDPQIARWTQVPQPYTIDDAHRFVADQAGADHLWAIDVNGLSGVISLSDTVAAMPGPTTEVGYWVAPWARGRGVATAALIAVRDACEFAGYQRINWQALSGNDGSLAVAVKAGFTIEGHRRQALLHRGRLVDSVVGGWTAQQVVAELVAGQWQVQPIEPDALPCALRPAGSSALAVWVARTAVGGEDSGHILAMRSPAGVHVVGADAPEPAVDAARRYLAAQGMSLTDERLPTSWL